MAATRPARRASAAGPLAGLRVLELGGIGPAPFAGMLLADLGADVVRIDRPGARSLTPDPGHDLLMRGKRSVVLDLQDRAGTTAARKLAGAADVLIEGFRPGVAERLGLGPDDVATLNPRLIYGRVTGWGQDGPLAGTAGHDIDFLAITGLLGAIGPAGGPPQIPLNLLGDFAGGSLFLLVGVLAALRERSASGLGQVVDAAIVDGAGVLGTMLHGLLAAGLWQDRRGANLLDGGAPQYAVYECADGGYLAVGALEGPFWAELLRLLGLDPAGLPDRDDPAARPELRERVAAAVRTRTRDEWVAVFEGSDACVAPVLSLLEAPSHPQLAGRGSFVTVDGVRQPGVAPRLSRTPGRVGTPPSALGADTRQVLLEWGVDLRTA